MHTEVTTSSLKEFQRRAILLRGRTVIDAVPAEYASCERLQLLVSEIHPKAISCTFGEREQVL